MNSFMCTQIPRKSMKVQQLMTPKLKKLTIIILHSATKQRSGKGKKANTAHIGPKAIRLDPIHYDPSFGMRVKRHRLLAVLNSKLFYIVQRYRCKCVTMLFGLRFFKYDDHNPMADYRRDGHFIFQFFTFGYETAFPPDDYLS